jgi:toxin-antitoxin system PIN domain toxin
VIVPDLNLLLYAVDESSARHTVAKAWLEQVINDSGEEVGLPWVVHLGFLRLTTNPKVFPRPLALEQALEWLDHLRAAPSVVPLNPGPGHAGILRHLLLIAGTGANLTTDAHLAALALENDATLATGDRDFLRFAGVKVVFPF